MSYHKTKTEPSPSQKPQPIVRRISPRNTVRVNYNMDLVETILLESSEDDLKPLPAAKKVKRNPPKLEETQGKLPAPEVMGTVSDTTAAVKSEPANFSILGLTSTESQPQPPAAMAKGIVSGSTSVLAKYQPRPPVWKVNGKASGTSAAIQPATGNTAALTQSCQSQPQPPPPLKIGLQIFSKTKGGAPTTWLGPASELDYTTLRELVSTYLKTYHSDRDREAPNDPEKGALVVVWHQWQVQWTSRRLVSSEKTWAILLGELEAGVPVTLLTGERVARLRIVLFP